MPPSRRLPPDYDFRGWYSDIGLTNAWDFGSGAVNSDITLYSKWEISAVVGDTVPAGGIVFYDKGSYSDGWRYLEVAPSNQGNDEVEWGGYETSVGNTSAAIGTGKTNTSEKNHQKSPRSLKVRQTPRTIASNSIPKE